MKIRFSHGLLRPFQLGDEEQLSKIADNYEIWKNLRDEFPRPYTLERAKGWIKFCQETSDTPRFAIEIDGLIQGGIGFKKMEGKNYEHSFEVGYWLAQNYWGKGIISAALRTVLDYAFNSLGLKRILAVAFEYNHASKHLLKKCGFVQEGIARKAVLKEEKYYDEFRYGLLAEEFNSKTHPVES